MKSAPKVIELFCGCGGMSSGLLQAGFNVRLGIDNNEAAIDTYNYNHEHVGSVGVCADIRELSGAELRERARLRGGLDLLTGGPPCQPFSIIGKRRALEDERGDLVLEYVRLVRELQPTAFIFENVPNFARIDEGRVADMVKNRLSRAGYALSDAILAVADYGVPQMRKRYLIVGVKDRQALGFPPATHGEMPLLGQKPVVTCKQALGDLPDVDTDEALQYRNHEGTTHSPAMLEMFKHLKPGERDPKSHHDRLHPDRPSYTLRAGNGNFSPLRPIHYKHDRVISVRESARIQGFADEYAWPDDMSRLQQYRQVGNAVPPPLAAAVGRHIAKALGFKLDPDTYARHASRSDRRHELTVDELIAKRRSFIRGASIGRDA